jgi:serralysin
MRYIDSTYLTNEYYAEVTSYLLDSRKRLHVYIDKSFIGRERTYITDMIRETDKIIGINFTFTNNKKIADIKFSQNNNFDIGVLGDTTYTCENGWEIKVNRSQSLKDKKWTIIHEFGHALGLEHPFDNTDDDYYESSYKFSSYGGNSDDTVMAYMYGETNPYPSFWTWNDKNALQNIWGTW